MDTVEDLQRRFISRQCLLLLSHITQPDAWPKLYLAADWRQLPGDGAQQCGLAAAIWAGQHGALTEAQLQVDVLKQHVAWIACIHVHQPDD